MVLAMFVCLRPARAADVADVKFEVSPRQTFVGLPVTVRISIIDADDYRMPEFPDIPGATVRAGGPGRSSSTTIINGRYSSQTTITYDFEVTPTSAGTLTIPSLTIVANGKEFKTDAVHIMVAKSDTGDLMSAEITADKDHVYQGESVDLTLTVWIKPYR